MTMSTCECRIDHVHKHNSYCYKHGGRCVECQAWRRRNYEALAGYAKRERFMRGGNVYVGRGPTVRRLRALARMGWSARLVAEAVGYTAHHVDLVRRDVLVDEVTVRFASAVSRVYEGLCMRVNDTRSGRQSMTRSKKAGWYAPLDWADIDAGVLFEDGDAPVFDHAAVQLAIDGVRVDRDWSDVELEAVVRVLVAEQRMADTHVADFLGVHSQRVIDARKRAGVEGVPKGESFHLRRVL